MLDRCEFLQIEQFCFQQSKEVFCAGVVKAVMLKSFNFEEGATARERNVLIGGHKA